MLITTQSIHNQTKTIDIWIRSKPVKPELTTIFEYKRPTVKNDHHFGVPRMVVVFESTRVGQASFNRAETIIETKLENLQKCAKFKLGIGMLKSK